MTTSRSPRGMDNSRKSKVATKRQDFNADKLSEQRGNSQITIGGRMFHPRKKTVNMMQEWADVSPDPDKIADEARSDPISNFRSITKQLNVLIRDDENGEPGVDFLDDSMDVEEAVALLGQLQPSFGVEAERQGHSAREDDGTAT